MKWKKTYRKNIKFLKILKAWAIWKKTETTWMKQPALKKKKPEQRDCKTEKKNDKNRQTNANLGRQPQTIHAEGRM